MLRQVLIAFRRPLDPARAAALRDHWQALDPELRTPTQMYGQGMTGCAATIGVMPTCNLSCTGCYLDDAADRQAPLPVTDIVNQLERIRGWTGPKGNVQITDGEVTLRDPADLVAIIQAARTLDLVPMLMTNGERIRREPELLARLVREGGLSEVCFHIDTTQHGRRGLSAGTTEVQLDLLREELAALVRRVRRTTGRGLRVATTMTVTRHNLAGVAHAIARYADNRDVYRLVSLQPVATVGRTPADLGPVDIDSLWREVTRGLMPRADEASLGGPLLIGHPSCTRFASYVCLRWPRSGRERFLKIVRHDSADDHSLLEGLVRGELLASGFRDEHRLLKIARIAGALWRSRRFVVGEGRRLLARRLADAGLSWGGMTASLVFGRLRMDSFCVVSHHFMDAEELSSPAGIERASNCVFRVPVDGRMVSMCEVNLRGLRK